MKMISLIPAYEPDDKLIDLVEELKKHDVYIVVVDDGSGSKYKKFFEAINDKAHVISYKKNRGKGYALKKGMQFIKKNIDNDYIVVTMDSDGQHTVEDGLKLCEFIKDNPEQLVIGKRLRDKKIPLRSKFGNEITKIIYHMSTGVNIYDTQSGLRAFSNKLINLMISIPGDRYEYEMNVLLTLPENKIVMKEIEIQTIYIDNNSGSHFKAVKDSIRIYKQIIKFWVTSFKRKRRKKK